MIKGTIHLGDILYCVSIGALSETETPHLYVGEASEILHVLPPGTWPAHFTADMQDVYLYFTRIEIKRDADNDVMWVDYQSGLDPKITVRIFND